MCLRWYIHSFRSIVVDIIHLYFPTSLLALACGKLTGWTVPSTIWSCLWTSIGFFSYGGTTYTCTSSGSSSQMEREVGLCTLWFCIQDFCFHGYIWYFTIHCSKDGKYFSRTSFYLSMPEAASITTMVHDDTWRVREVDKLVGLFLIERVYLGGIIL